jgi:zinc finger CCHC domain-containing protein 8
MALRLARITLFSAPNCSLCEVRPPFNPASMSSFLSNSFPDGQNRASSCTQVGTFLYHPNIVTLGDRHLSIASFQPRDDKYPGQRAGELEEEICSLDSRNSPRGQGDCEREMERTDRDTSPRPLGECWRGSSGEKGIDEIDVTRTAFVDTMPTPINYLWDSSHAYLYARIDDEVLGEEELESDFQHDPVASSHCFNCGSPAHMVSSCPSPRDPQVIALSRQLHNFLQALRGVNSPGEPKRIHVVEEWKRQRLEWLDEFDPGQVRGLLLRDALGLDSDDAPWLQNMTMWGYPKGWVAERDPRDRVRQRIQDEGVDFNDCIDDDEILAIFGEDGDLVDPMNDKGDGSRIPQSGSGPSSEPFCTAAVQAQSDISESCRSPKSITSIRWAQYPSTRFSSELLPVYSGFTLPSMTRNFISNIPVNDGTVSSRVNSEWTSVTHGPAASQEGSAVPPWRLPDALAGYHYPPPPPLDSPPPLPPSPPPCLDGLSEDDMDLSDSD